MTSNREPEGVGSFSPIVDVTVSLRAVLTLELSENSKTTTLAKINARNHLLQWYEVQDNKCSEIISYNGRQGRGGARLQSGLPNGDFARSCGLDSRKEVESRGRNQILCFLIFLH
jgi:hypothetical protein